MFALFLKVIHRWGLDKVLLFATIRMNKQIEGPSIFKRRVRQLFPLHSPHIPTFQYDKLGPDSSESGLISFIERKKI